jgi:hypothetical protein
MVFLLFQWRYSRCNRVYNRCISRTKEIDMEPDDEYPAGAVTQEEIEASIAEDPNAK